MHASGGTVLVVVVVVVLVVVDVVVVAGGGAAVVVVVVAGGGAAVVVVAGTTVVLVVVDATLEDGTLLLGGTDVKAVVPGTEVDAAAIVESTDSIPSSPSRVNTKINAASTIRAASDPAISITVRLRSGSGDRPPGPSDTGGSCDGGTGGTVGMTSVGGRYGSTGSVGTFGKISVGPDDGSGGGPLMSPLMEGILSASSVAGGAPPSDRGQRWIRSAVVKVLRRVLAALLMAGAAAAAVRVKGKGGTPPQHGGWRPLDLPDGSTS